MTGLSGLNSEVSRRISGWKAFGTANGSLARNWRARLVKVEADEDEIAVVAARGATGARPRRNNRAWLSRHRRHTDAPKDCRASIREGKEAGVLLDRTWLCSSSLPGACSSSFARSVPVSDRIALFWTRRVGSPMRRRVETASCSCQEIIYNCLFVWQPFYIQKSKSS